MNEISLMNQNLETCYQSNELIKAEKRRVGQENESLRQQIENMRSDIETYKKSHQHALILKGGASMESLRGRALGNSQVVP